MKSMFDVRCELENSEDFIREYQAYWTRIQFVISEKAMTKLVLCYK